MIVRVYLGHASVWKYSFRVDGTSAPGEGEKVELVVDGFSRSEPERLVCIVKSRSYGLMRDNLEQDFMVVNLFCDVVNGE